MSEWHTCVLHEITKIPLMTVFFETECSSFDVFNSEPCFKT